MVAGHRFPTCRLRTLRAVGLLLASPVAAAPSTDAPPATGGFLLVQLRAAHLEPAAPEARDPCAGFCGLAKLAGEAEGGLCWTLTDEAACSNKYLWSPGDSIIKPCVWESNSCVAKPSSWVHGCKDPMSYCGPVRHQAQVAVRLPHGHAATPHQTIHGEEEPAAREAHDPCAGFCGLTKLAGEAEGGLCWTFTDEAACSNKYLWSPGDSVIKPCVWEGNSCVAKPSSWVHGCKDPMSYCEPVRHQAQVAVQLPPAHAASAHKEILGEEGNSPCDCMVRWNYQGNWYSGCQKSWDYPFKWCYVRSTKTCPGSHQTVFSEGDLHWRHCGADENAQGAGPPNIQELDMTSENPFEHVTSLPKECAMFFSSCGYETNFPSTKAEVLDKTIECCDENHDTQVCIGLKHLLTEGYGDESPSATPSRMFCNQLITFYVVGSSGEADQVTAGGDPHLKNILGETFSLDRAGVYDFITLPRGASDDDVVLALRVRTEETRGGNFITGVELMGSAIGPNAIRVVLNGTHLKASVGSVFQRVPAHYRMHNTPHYGNVTFEMPTASKVTVTVGKACFDVVKGNPPHEYYLNLAATSLKTLGLEVGGALGLDKPSDATDSEESQFLLGVPSIAGPQGLNHLAFQATASLD